MNHTDPTADFDGCRRVCRQQGVHTLVRGECERAPEPEPTVSLSRPYTAPDGFPGIVFDRYTVLELAGLIEPALRRVAVRLGPNALGMLGRGETVGLSGGEYADLAWTAAHAIVHRHDGPPAVSVPPPPPARAATRGLSVPHRDALYDAVAPPGPARPTFPEQHERVCRAVAEILDEVAPPVPAADRAAVLREAADWYARQGKVVLAAAQVAADLRCRADAELCRMADEAQQQRGTEAQAFDGRCPACGHTVCDGEGPCGARSGDDFCTCPGPPPAEQQPAADEEHVCKPGTGLYWCPTSGQTESDCHGGFDVCCDRPDLHRPIAVQQPAAADGEEA